MVSPPSLLYATRPLGGLARELTNALRYGAGAPRVDERLWIDPLDVQRAFAHFPAQSGRVVRRWPPAAAMPLADHVHVRFALAHWRDGVPWEETGALEYMEERIAARGHQDGCQTREDVIRRFRALDALYEEIARLRRLRTRQEIDVRCHRENGGILIHFGPDGEPVAGDSGKHRLTIAQLLQLPMIPVRVGHVHRDALEWLPRLRKGPT